LYVSRGAELNETEHDLLEFFAHSLAVAYDNIYMREMVKQSQKEISYIIGEAVERRSKETGSHVKRVAHYSYMMAIQYGLSEFEADVIRLASPLHDVGKIAIPDNILNKPAKLDDEEWAVMQTHAQIGQDIFKQSQNEILQMGAIIAGQHHEKWDGSGYPNGLKGEDIHIAGRITALADVFDALASDRCYKPAWPMDKVLALLNEQSGQHFEPKLVQILMDNLEDYLAIRDLYPD
jgi:response regulator RpfG family c-di-GMP phosphodiesterase